MNEPDELSALKKRVAELESLAVVQAKTSIDNALNFASIAEIQNKTVQAVDEFKSLIGILIKIVLDNAPNVESKEKLAILSDLGRMDFNLDQRAAASTNIHEKIEKLKTRLQGLLPPDNPPGS